MAIKLEEVRKHALEKGHEIKTQAVVADFSKLTQIEHY